MSDNAAGNEEARLAALDACAIMGTSREPAFDSIVFTAAQLFRAPIAVIAIIGADTVWAKASVGLVEMTQPRLQTFAGFMVRTGEPLIVEDALADSRYAQLAAVSGPPHVRFFAAAPIFATLRAAPSGQHVIGAAMVADRHPRTVSERQRAQLIQLARDAEEVLRLRVESLPYETR